MKTMAKMLVGLVLVVFFCSCGTQQPQEQKEDINVQYFFSGKVLDVSEEHLKLEVFYTGNTNFSEESVVEVSTDVVAAAGCPEFTMGERARVVMARNTEDAPVERLQALAIYKEDEEGNVYAVGEEPSEPTPTLAPGQDQALPTTMIDGEIYFMSGMYATTKPSEISQIKEILEQAEYLGTTTKISAKEYPTKDLESNCLEEGCKIYRHADGDRINFIIVRPNGLTYRYVSGWTKYQWLEGKLINAGEQEYLKTGMPTPTATPVPNEDVEKDTDEE